jgi:hypothetical protein
MDYHAVLGLTTVTPADLVINTKTFSVNSKRPEGWDRLRLRRVLLKEQNEYNRNIPIQVILSKRENRLTEVRILFSLFRLMMIDVCLGGDMHVERSRDVW